MIIDKGVLKKLLHTKSKKADNNKQVSECSKETNPFPPLKKLLFLRIKSIKQYK